MIYGTGVYKENRINIVVGIGRFACDEFPKIIVKSIQYVIR